MEVIRWHAAVLPSRRPLQALRAGRGRAARADVPRALVLGSLLGLVFGASSVYLALRVGLTVSASVPIAVLSITIFRALSRILPGGRASILENTVVQTTGSAGESIAAGVAFTLPALVLLGFEMDWTRTLLLSLCGGVLGVLMMIPLRRYLIVKEHGRLTYPEGTAAAEVLMAGEERGAQAKLVFQGLFVGLGYKFLTAIVAAVARRARAAHPALQGGAGVGGRLARADGRRLHHRLPLVRHHGGRRPAVLARAHPRHRPVRRGPRGGALPGHRAHRPDAARSTSGAATSATSARARWPRAGSSTSSRRMPTIIDSFRASFRDLRLQRGRQAAEQRRAPSATSRSRSCSADRWPWPLFMAFLPQLKAVPGFGIAVLSAVAIIVFGFFFSVVSSRITGELGSSSNPVSGMAIATLMGVCLHLRRCWAGPGTPTPRPRSPSEPWSASRPATPAPPART